MEKKELFIKRFEIDELFGMYNVNIPFNNNINIFIGENGLGKTTILNALNYIIQGDGESLSSIDFDKIRVTLGNGSVVVIEHNELLKLSTSLYDIRHRHSQRYSFDDESNTIIRKLSLDILKEKEKISLNTIKNQKNEIRERIISKYKDKINPFTLENLFDLAYGDKLLENQLKKSWEFKIYSYMKKYNNVIYLPTYRRIEEDFNSFVEHNVDYIKSSKRKNNFSYLQFGMDDVQTSLDKTCATLKNNTNEGFKEMTTNLLTNYIRISDDINLNIKKLNKNQISNLKIVFSRLADKIDPIIIEKLMVLLKKNKSDDDRYHKYLFSIINELNSIYEKNMQIDESLENFMNVCNNYLVNKEVIYDKFKIECNVVEKHTQRIISLKNLSSGEKQILSLFSKLYLNQGGKNIILFDEPELSLSIIWQSRLVPDIINSNKCAFLAIITHSPFIFDNKYVANAIDIKDYIRNVS